VALDEHPEGLGVAAPRPGDDQRVAVVHACNLDGATGKRLVPNTAPGVRRRNRPSHSRTPVLNRQTRHAGDFPRFLPDWVANPPRQPWYSA